jgi:lipopolysaccharide transport system permease protein
MSLRHDTEVITMYDGTGRDRLSLQAWRVMVTELWDYRELIHRLLIRSIAGPLRQSFLGYFWIVLPPLATALIFSILRSAAIVQVPMDGHSMPYLLFALIGATVWGLFTQCVSSATASIAGAGTLVSKIYFPRETLVISSVGTALFNGLVRLLVVALMFVVVGFKPHPAVTTIPLLLLPMILLAIGVGFMLAVLNTMMQDVAKFIEFGFQFGMFLAPTVYPTPSLAAALADSSTPGTNWQLVLYWLHNINPVTHFIHAIHHTIEVGWFSPTPAFTAATILSIFTFLAGWRIFHMCEPLLAERL